MKKLFLTIVAIIVLLFVLPLTLLLLRGDDIDYGAVTLPYVIHGVDYCVPRKYLHWTSKAAPSNGVSDVIFLEAVDPDLSPFTKRRKEYYKDGETWRQITIWVDNGDESRPLEIGLSDMLEVREASVIAGEEYGLMHYTQPSDKNTDNPDYWVSYYPNGEIEMYLHCSEVSGAAINSLCSARYVDAKNLFYWLTFNKKQLKDWREIIDNASALITDFECSNHIPNTGDKSWQK